MQRPQKYELQCVPHVQHDKFSSFNFALLFCGVLVDDRVLDLNKVPSMLFYGLVNLHTLHVLFTFLGHFLAVLEMTKFELLRLRP